MVKSLRWVLLIVALGVSLLGCGSSGGGPGSGGATSGGEAGVNAGSGGQAGEVDTASSGQAGEVDSASGGNAGSDESAVGGEGNPGSAGNAERAGSGGSVGSSGSGGDVGSGASAGSAGNAGNGGSGGSAGGAHTGREVVCQTLAAGPCSVTTGDAGKLIVGTVLTPDVIYRGGQVLVSAAGAIVQVGCKADCDANADCRAQASAATAITCPSGVVSPALINSYDHLTYTQNSPVPSGLERYEDRQQWRLGLDGHTKITSTGSASNDQLHWGELRFLLGGAVSTVGNGGVAGLLRNLDEPRLQEGLSAIQVVPDTFPLGDSSGPRLISGCAYPSLVTSATVSAGDAYLPQTAQGIDAYARNEFTCVEHDVLTSKSALVGPISLSAAMYGKMIKTGTGLIWTPRSNLALYGDTTAVTAAARLGGLIALGTDWIPTGSMNLLRELRCADSFNAAYLDHAFSDRELWLMVTRNAALVTATDPVLGSLAPGKLGDIAIFDGSAHADYRAVIDANPEDVLFVMRGGKALYGNAALISGVPGATGCDTLDVCGVSKQVCLSSETGLTLPALQAAVGGIYPAFACIAPANEPSCVPARSVSVNGSTVYTGAITTTDRDGDGIADGADNCPSVFNPIRPVDNGEQADFDGDGLGDTCDPCPLDAGSTTCVRFNPDDRDADGILTTTDNCPIVSNPDQADADGDHKGDACDACPDAANPGSAGCPTTIYSIKNGTVATGSTVSLTGQLVTASTNEGFFLQVKSGDPDYNGSADYSGIFVSDPENTVQPGDRITVSSAQIANFLGEIELVNPTVLGVSTGEALPAPLVASASEVATGGSRSARLEGVIVHIVNTTVSDIASQSSEFVVDGSLVVAPDLYLASPFPVVGALYSSLSGILELRDSESKLAPRAATDLVLGAGILSSFGPSLSFAAVGQSGAPTFPSPLTVLLSSPAQVDTFISVVSTTGLAITGGGVTIPSGMTSAPVSVSGLAQTRDVTLTATLGAVSLTADVRVVASSESASLSTLTASTPMVTPGGTVTLTVALDIPAPAGGTSVQLALAPVNAGTLPTAVQVPSGQLRAAFDVLLNANATVTATLGTSTLSTSISATGSAGLVINEIDYDNVGTDSAEFIEIYNSGSAAQALTGYHLALVNGSNSVPYQTIDLSPAGVLGSGKYLVVGAESVTATLPSDALALDLGVVSNFIQNGSPDGVVLINSSSQSVVDAFSYEGAISAATLGGGVGTVSLVEGTLLPVSVADSNVIQGSLARLPNGIDTNQASSDWRFSTTPTPGGANVP